MTIVVDDLCDTCPRDLSYLNPSLSNLTADHQGEWTDRWMRVLMLPAEQPHGDPILRYLIIGSGDPAVR